MKAILLTSEYFTNPPAGELPPGRDQWFDHHFKSTLADNIIELCGRKCYDSAKTEATRSSADYHRHINDVGHGSVQESVQIALPVPADHDPLLFRVLMMRPGVYYTIDPYRSTPMIIANLRAIREWEMFGLACQTDTELLLYHRIRDELVATAKSVCPLAMSDFKMPKNASVMGRLYNYFALGDTPAIRERELQHWDVHGNRFPKDVELLMVNFLISGVTRNLTHELVRHKYQTAISQRSTRYVDESESDFIDHPLITQYGAAPGHSDLRIGLVEGSREMYRVCYKHLYDAQVAAGVDKFTAKKSARGAARGYLLSSLGTELVFSATVAQWKRILAQRNNPAADPEIKALAGLVEVELKAAKLIGE